MNYRVDNSLSNWLSGQTHEVLAVEYLAANLKPLSRSRFSNDCLDGVDLPLREVIARALALDARVIVIAHNHPQGDECPSGSDITATRLLSRVCADLNIVLHDHIICSSNGQFSFRTEGLL